LEFLIPIKIRSNRVFRNLNESMRHVLNSKYLVLYHMIYGIKPAIEVSVIRIVESKSFIVE